MTLGRVVHEFSRGGDIFHPLVADWRAEEYIPGGFGPAQGKISERDFRRHRELFSEGAIWRTFLEADGTCVHAGKLLHPDIAGGYVALSDRGWMTIADRYVGGVLYQADDSLQFGTFYETGRWSVAQDDVRGRSPYADELSFGVSLAFKRSAERDVDESTESGGIAAAVIPLYGQDLTRLAADIWSNAPGGEGGNAAFVIRVYSGRHSSETGTVRELLSSGTLYSNWIGTVDDGTNFTAHIELDLDLHLDDSDVTGGDNRGAGANVTITWPDYVIIEVGSAAGSDLYEPAGELWVTNIRINGAVGPELGADFYSPSDVVSDLVGRIGIGHSDIEPGGFNVLPYSLGDGETPADGLDYMSLVTGKYWRILDEGSGPIFQFQNWKDAPLWELASPWADFEAIPEERFDRVWVPFRYPSERQVGSVLVQMENSPLDAINVYTGLDAASPSASKEHAEGFGQQVLEVVSKKRSSGSFRAATIMGEDGVETSAHHIFAGDTLRARGRGGGRLRISQLTRTDDGVSGQFDGSMSALDRLLERRERRIARRTRRS